MKPLLLCKRSHPQGNGTRYADGSCIACRRERPRKPGVRRLRTAPPMRFETTGAEPCAQGANMFLFFTEERHNPGQLRERVEAAKNLCGTCPIVAECADWGVRHERYGVWGGLSERERTAIRARDGIRVPPDNFSAAMDQWVVGVRARREEEWSHDTSSSD